jgi:hypothetical protein
MSIQPAQNLTLLMDKISATLLLIDQQKVSISTPCTVSKSSAHTSNIDEEIRKVSNAIFSLEQKIKTLDQDLSSSSNFIKKYGLVKEGDIRRWKLLNARFAIGCAEHQHKNSENQNHLCATACGSKERGFYLLHSRESHHMNYAGYMRPDKNYEQLGWKYNPKSKRYEKDEHFLEEKSLKE